MALFLYEKGELTLFNAIRAQKTGNCNGEGIYRFAAQLLSCDFVTCLLIDEYLDDPDVRLVFGDGMDFDHQYWDYESLNVFLGAK